MGESREGHVETAEWRLLVVLQAVTETVDGLSEAGDDWENARMKLCGLRVALLDELAGLGPSLRN
jgi:hypothetical protein